MLASREVVRIEYFLIVLHPELPTGFFFHSKSSSSSLYVMINYNEEYNALLINF